MFHIINLDQIISKFLRDGWIQGRVDLVFCVCTGLQVKRETQSGQMSFRKTFLTRFFFLQYWTAYFIKTALKWLHRLAHNLLDLGPNIWGHKSAGQLYEKIPWVGGGAGQWLTVHLSKMGNEVQTEMDVCRCWSALFPLTTQHTRVVWWDAAEGPKLWTFVSCLFVFVRLNAVTHRDDEREMQRWIINSSRDVNVGQGWKV